MSSAYLDFEKPVLELETQLEQLQLRARWEGVPDTLVEGHVRKPNGVDAAHVFDLDKFEITAAE